MCGYVQTSEISYSGTQVVHQHNFCGWTILKLSTKTEKGLKERECTSCKYKETSQIPVIGHVHNYTNWIVSKEATEEETGLKEKVCQDCGEKLTEIIEKLPHIHGYESSEVWSFTKKYHWHDATCRCGEKIQRDTDVHTFPDGLTVCSVCGYDSSNASLTPKGTAVINIDISGIEYDPAIETEIKDIVVLNGLSGNAIGEAVRPEFTFNGTVLSCEARVETGEYELCLLNVETEINIKNVNICENSTITESFKIADVVTDNNVKEDMFITHGGIFGKHYLVFESDAGFTLYARKNWSGTLYYSLNLTDWTEWEGEDINAAKFGGKSESFYIFLRGKGNGKTLNENIDNPKTFFILKNYISAECHGNIMTLLEYDNPGDEAGDYCFYGLFEHDTFREFSTAPDRTNNITIPPAFPAKKVGEAAYARLFSSAKKLKKAPCLPATEIGEICYSCSFAGCDELTTTPKILPALTMKDSCYAWMFANCPKITTGPEILATTLANECFYSMYKQSNIKITEKNTGYKLMTVPDKGCAPSTAFRGDNWPSNFEVGHTYYYDVSE